MHTHQHTDGHTDRQTDRHNKTQNNTDLEPDMTELFLVVVMEVSPLKSVLGHGAVG